MECDEYVEYAEEHVLGDAEMDAPFDNIVSMKCAYLKIGEGRKKKVQRGIFLGERTSWPFGG